MTSTFSEFRDFATDGVPASGAHKPIKSGIRKAIAAFKDVSTLLADTAIDYTDVSTGDVIQARKEGFAYEVAASDATDHDVTTAGGVKLYVLPGPDGKYDVKSFGCAGDGTTYDTAALQAAANKDVHLVFRDGIYRINGSVVFPGDMRLEFVDGATVLADVGTYSTFYAFSAAGSVTQISDLGAAASLGERSLTLAAAPDLSFDDVIIIQNPTDSSWSGYRADYRAGEFVAVEGASGTAVSLQSALYDSYAVADVDVYKVSPIAVDLENIKMTGVSGGPFGLVRADYARDVNIDNPQLENNGNSCLLISKSLGGEILSGRCRNVGSGGNDYGLSISNSQGITIFGGHYYARRHGVASGGGPGVGSVPCRAIKYIGSRIDNDILSGVFAADMHGNAEFCGFYECTINNGATLQGANNDLLDNTILCGTSIGVVVTLTEVLGGTMRITGNRLKTFADPSVSGNRGVIDAGGNSPAITATMTRDLTLVVHDNDFESEHLSSNTNIVVVRNRGSAKKINVDAQNNRFLVNAMKAAVWVDGASGTYDSDFLICDHNVSNVAGAYGFLTSNYTSLPVLRCQAHRWLNEVTLSTSAAFASGSPETFTWRFPRDPAILASKMGSLYESNRIGIAVADGVSDQQATLSIGTDAADNFPVANAVKLIGEAAIREV